MGMGHKAVIGRALQAAWIIIRLGMIAWVILQFLPYAAGAIRGF